MLGILEKTPEFKVGSLNFSDNDVLLLYTDGVNESIDENGNEYGMVRLNNLLKSAKSKNASSILTEVYSSVEHFSKNTDQYDDITAILIKKEKTNVS
jgi:serine phosphatase RsbU (regulator of sigma subunit)